mmetsp:Transcript_26526/g.67480  ORF Transcript_26526/g.67480 Transcript_26526/m.67480 type:complete len:354 (+) Transcript_26526:696-1757(+)
MPLMLLLLSLLPSRCCELSRMESGAGGGDGGGRGGGGGGRGSRLLSQALQRQLLLLQQLLLGGAQQRARRVVQLQALYDVPLATRASDGVGEHEAGGHPVRAVRHHTHGHPLAARGAQHPVAHVVAHRGGGRQGGGQAASLDDGRTALLHRGDELAVEPRVVGHGGADGLAVHGAVVHVGVLRGGVVAPDDDVAHVGVVRPSALRHLADGAVVVQAREAGDVLRGDAARSVLLEDERVGVGGVGHHHDLHALGSTARQRGRLAAVDGHVLGHDVLALLARLARVPAHHDRDVHALRGRLHVGERAHALQQGVRGIKQLHAHALQRILGRLNIQQVKDHRLVRAQHAAGRHHRA